MSILVNTTPPLDATRASFRTHLNYIKCLGNILSSCTLSATNTDTRSRSNTEIDKFRKLYNVTVKSVKKDIELAKEDAAFAVIAAPWFPVKCYYALYYLESVLIHLIDGCTYGFGKGGHAGVRKKIYSLVENGSLSFSTSEINQILTLPQIYQLPAVNPGQNTRTDFWQKAECLNLVSKKLMEYKLHDAKLGQKWNLRTKKDRDEQKKFIDREKLMYLDFFYWYRIKANYRDLDYIDFESGITEMEVLDYINIFFQTFNHYRNQLVAQINILYKTQGLGTGASSGH